MMRTDTGATTAGGNLIWTATVPAFRCYGNYPDEKNPTASGQHHEVRLWGQSGGHRQSEQFPEVGSPPRECSQLLPEFNYEGFATKASLYQFLGLPGWSSRRTSHSTQ